MDNKEKTYTARQASLIFGVTVRTVQRWLKENRFPNAYKAYDAPTAPKLIPESDLQKVIEEIKSNK